MVQLARDFCVATDHQFWPDSVALSDDQVFDDARLRGHRQITDAYLLALAVAIESQNVTFDAAIAAAAAVVQGANERHILVV